MFLKEFFYIILYKPLVNLLVLLYNFLPGSDFGVAVIALTLIVKLLLLPSSLKSIRSQRALTKIQPKIKELQRKFKDDKQKQAFAVMELYKKEGINPASGCLPFLVQLPILIALYQVFLKGFREEALKPFLYSFVSLPKHFDFMFLGAVNLLQPSLFLAILAGGLQFFQTRISLSHKPASSLSDKKADFSNLLQSQMLYFFPLLTVFIVWRFGAVLGLYWITSTVFSIGEHYLIKFLDQKNEDRTK